MKSKKDLFNHWEVKTINENGLSLVNEFHILAENVNPEIKTLLENSPQMKQVLELALGSIKQYHEYGETMREHGRGFHSNYKGFESDYLIGVIKHLLGKIEGE